MALKLELGLVFQGASRVARYCATVAQLGRSPGRVRIQTGTPSIVGEACQISRKTGGRSDGSLWARRRLEASEAEVRDGCYGVHPPAFPRAARKPVICCSALHRVLFTAGLKWYPYWYFGYCFLEVDIRNLTPWCVSLENTH